MSVEPAGAGPLGRLPPAGLWGILLPLTAALAALFYLLHLPAALLLGPMAAAILVAVGGAELRIPRPPDLLAQGLIGCMIARALSVSLHASDFADWPLFLAGVLSVVGIGALLSWIAVRLGHLPAATAAWGLSPGGATAMVVMAATYGADIRMVALMQYLRLVLVAASASLVAGFWGAGPHPVITHAVWFPPLHVPAFAETLAVATIGPLLARRLRIGGGAMLIPMALALALGHAGLMSIELPPWLLALTYAVIGWRVGLRFTAQSLVHAIRALPVLLACILAMIVLCGGLAALMVAAAGVDPLTAFLATSPGGADTVAIIAASSPVDAGFVMAMQMARFLAIMALGPPLARLISRLEPGR